MTVKELIEALSEMPQDMQVFTGDIYDNDFAFVPVTGVAVSNMSQVDGDYHVSMFGASSPDTFEGVAINP